MSRGHLINARASAGARLVEARRALKQANTPIEIATFAASARRASDEYESAVEAEQRSPLERLPEPTPLRDALELLEEAEEVLRDAIKGGRGAFFIRQAEAVLGAIARTRPLLELGLTETSLGMAIRDAAECRGACGGTGRVCYGHNKREAPHPHNARPECQDHGVCPDCVRRAIVHAARAGGQET